LLGSGLLLLKSNALAYGLIAAVRTENIVDDDLETPFLETWRS
jgi:hypothetical protein